MAEINLLPRKIRPRKSLEFPKRYVIIIVCFLILLAYFLHNKMTFQKHIKAYDELEIEISQIEKLVEEFSILETQENSLKSQIQSYSMLLRDHSSWGEKLNDISILVPENLWVTELHMEEEKFLMINGHALTLADIATFIAGLNDTPYYTSVRLHNAIEEKRDALTLLKFEIICGI